MFFFHGITGLGILPVSTDVCAMTHPPRNLNPLKCPKIELPAPRGLGGDQFTNNSSLKWTEKDGFVLVDRPGC